MKKSTNCKVCDFNPNNHLDFIKKSNNIFSEGHLVQANAPLSKTQIGFSNVPKLDANVIANDYEETSASDYREFREDMKNPFWSVMLSLTHIFNVLNSSSS